jgi:hypothetical protein
MDGPSSAATSDCRAVFHRSHAGDAPCLAPVCEAGVERNIPLQAPQVPHLVIKKSEAGRWSHTESTLDSFFSTSGSEHSWSDLLAVFLF